MVNVAIIGNNKNKKTNGGLVLEFRNFYFKLPTAFNGGQYVGSNYKWDRNAMWIFNKFQNY